jgi:hypothetical protein
MKSLQLFGFLAVMAIGSTSLAFAADNDRLDPNNPNCSPGVKGCTANYPTSDVTKANPTTQNAQDPNNPNCSPGTKGCAANYPTSDTTKKNPQQHQQQKK